MTEFDIAGFNCIIKRTSAGGFAIGRTIFFTCEKRRSRLLIGQNSFVYEILRYDFFVCFSIARKISPDMRFLLYV